MNEILELNQRIMDRAEGQLLRSVEDVERELYEAVRRVLYSFETKAGYFVPDEARLNVINELKKEVKKILSRSSMRESLDDFFAEFDKIGENMKAFHQKENGISVPQQLVNEQKKFIVNQTVDSIIGAGADARFVDPIKRSLFNHVNFGSSVLDAEAEMRKMIIGEGEKAGILRRWVGQVARDSIQQYEGGINARIAVEYDLKYFRYVGSLVEDSRPQCVRWVNMGYISVDEIAAEIEWAKRAGSGMYPGTTVASFAVLRGGYNCRHTAYPTNNPGERPDPVTPPGKKPPTGKKPGKKPGKKKSPPAAVLSGSRAKDYPNAVTDHPMRPSNYAEILNTPEGSAELPKEFWDMFKVAPTVRKALAKDKGSYARGNAAYFKLEGRYSKHTRKVAVHELGHILHDQYRVFTLADEKMPDWFESFWKKARQIAGQDIRGAEKEIRDNKLLEIFRSVGYKDAVGDDFLSRAGYYERARVARKYNLEMDSEYEREAWGAFADTVGALTRNKFGYGHKNSYYAPLRGWGPSSGTYYQKAEVFAHAMEARWFAENPYTKELLPDLYEAMQKMMEDFERAAGIR